MSEEIWVRCEICGKGFDSYEALVSHLYSHIDELEQKLREANQEAAEARR
jgi:hypothetical protein